VIAAKRQRFSMLTVCIALAWLGFNLAFDRVTDRGIIIPQFLVPGNIINK